MKIILNDLSFCYTGKTKYDIVESFKEFVDALAYLMLNHVRYELIMPETYSYRDLGHDLNIILLLNSGVIDRTKKSVVLSILTKAIPAKEHNDMVFIVDQHSSSLCAWALHNKYIAISINTTPILCGASIEGLFISDYEAEHKAQLDNISNVSHIEVHKNKLDIRKYEPNKKHDIETSYISIMDLSVEEAQSVLNKAVYIKNDKRSLVSKHNGAYYIFRNHKDNCFHGYRCNIINDKLKKLIGDIKSDRS